MSTLYYRPGTSELKLETMDHETDQSVQNSLVDGVPNYAQPDPMKHREKSMAKQDNGEQKGETVNIKKINPPENGQLQNNSDGEVNGAYNFWDLSDSEIRLLDRRSQMDTSRKYWPHYFSSDYLYPGETNFEPTNWDWLRLNALGPGWEEVLKDVPVTRREALNLLVIMKRKLLRAAGKLTYYKERVTVLQDQLIHQKKNEEKLIRLQAEYKTQSLDLEKAQEQASRVPLLEKTVKQQEDLICRLETFLDRQRNNTERDNNRNHGNILENENLRTAIADNERLELYKMLDNSELRIKALEEELQRQRNPKSHLPREPAWKYSGPKKIHQSLPQLNKRNGPNNLVSVNTHKQSPITDLNMHFPSHNNKGLNRVLNKRQIHMNNHINSSTNSNNNDNNVNHINESNESNAFDYSMNRDEEDF
ncbi:unnamed protein product [Trichobilharzia szidati]|nr:unnamed protein product [Trichobilharzia szidati]